MKRIKKQCKDNGLLFEKCGQSSYKITLLGNEEILTWACSSLKECKEAIVQALWMKGRVLNVA